MSDVDHNRGIVKWCNRLYGEVACTGEWRLCGKANQDLELPLRARVAPFADGSVPNRLVRGASSTPRQPKMLPSDPPLRWTPLGRAPTILPHRSEEHTSELQSLAYLVCRL